MDWLNLMGARTFIHRYITRMYTYVLITYVIQASVPALY